MPDIVEELKKKRKTIEQFQRDQANQEGQKEQLSKQLKDVCGATSIDEAEKAIEELVEECDESKKLLKALDEELGEIIDKASPRSGT